MMKIHPQRLITLIISVFYMTASPCYAAERSDINTGPVSQLPDTAKTFTKKTRTLEEVVVESAAKKRIPQGVAFFPSKREKNLATDAVKLIEMMALTELPYDYAIDAVTTPNGSSVTYFIDGREATQKELKALNPKDVDRIEYYPSPTYGDFIGKRDVVNYVMKKYLSGGFTRIYSQQHLDGDFGDYSLTSRLVYRKVTLDGYFDGAYINTTESGSITDNTYKDFVYNATRHDEVKSTIDGRDSRYKREDLGAFIKATWSHRSVDLLGTIGWNWTETPGVANRYATTYSPEIINSSFAMAQRSSLDINPYAILTARFKLPHSQNISVKMSGNYLSDRSSYLYTPHNLEPIYNGSGEKNWSVVGILSYDKSFDNSNSLGITAAVSNKKDKVDYAGSFDGVNDFHGVYTSFSATYSHSLSQRTSLSLSGGFDNDRQEINNTRSSIWSPNIYVSLSHAWNDKSNLKVSTSVFGVPYPLSFLNDVTLHVSELLWRRGNPDLKNRMWWQTSISNTWNFSRNLSLTLNGLYTHIFNKDFNVWSIDPELEGVVNSYSDNGDVDWCRAGTKLTYKLFNRKLVLTGSFDYDFYKFSGVYHKTKSYVKGSASAVWYGNKWYVGLVFVPSTWGAFDNTNVESYTNWKYRVNLGYTYRNFNLSAAIINPFGKNLSDIREVDTAHFSQRVRNYSYRAANSFQVNIIYTFSYGKKVSKPFMQITDRLESGALNIN